MTTQNEQTTQHGNRAKHTPKPWVIDTDGCGKANAIITSTHDKNGPDDDICEVYGGNDDNPKVRAANARLIAAAPELLEALESIATLAICCPHDQPDACNRELTKIMRRARAAIAKARGESK